MRHLIIVIAFLFPAEFLCPDPAGVYPKHIVGLTYPRVAHLAGIEGIVELEALLAKGGEVQRVRVISGNALLSPAAAESLRRWTFSPCPASASPCRFSVTFRFVLQEGDCHIGECPNDIEFDLPDTLTLKSKHALAIVN